MLERHSLFVQLFKAYALSVLFKQYLCESICCLDSQHLLTLKCAVSFPLITYFWDVVACGQSRLWLLLKCGLLPFLPTCHWGCILVRHIIIGSFAQLWSPWLCSPTNRCKWLLILKLLRTCNVNPKFASLITAFCAPFVVLVQSGPFLPSRETFS